MTAQTEIIFVITKIVLALTTLLGMWLFVRLLIPIRRSKDVAPILLLSLSITGWSATTLANLWLAHTLVEIMTYVFGMLTAASITWFAFTFQEERSLKRSLLILAPALIFTGVASIPGFIFNGFLIHPTGFTETNGALGYFIFHALFFAYLLLAIGALLSRSFRTHNATLRQQLNFFATSVALLLVLRSLAIGLLSGFFDIGYFNTLGPTMACIPLLIAYAIHKQYYYVDLRYILYGFIGKLAFSLFAGLIYLGALLLLQLLAQGHNILIYHIAFVITLLASLKIAPILEQEAVGLAAGPKEQANKEAVERFILDLFEQQHTPLEIANASAQLCGDILNVRKSQLIVQATGNERELALLGEIKEKDDAFLEEPTILLLESASPSEIGEPTPKEKLAEELRNIYGAALIATLSSQQTLYGLLILTERKDGRGYSKEDIALIQSILVPLSTALAEATFRSKIALLMRSSDSETGKLREKVFRKNLKQNELLRTLGDLQREALYQLGHKLEAIKTHGEHAVHAALETLEHAELEIAQQTSLIETEAMQPIVEHTDLAPLIHKLIEVYGARSLIRQSHLSYTLPERIPFIGDPQQIYEAIALLLQDMFSDDCSEEVYISFNILLEPEKIKVLITQTYKALAEKPHKMTDNVMEKCLRVYENPLAVSLIMKNGGTFYGEHHDHTATTTITLERDTEEDRGGIDTDLKRAP